MSARSNALVDQFKTLLAAGGTGAGTRVFKARTWSVNLPTLPAILIEPLYREQRKGTGSDGVEFDTVTTITLRGRAAASGNNDDAGGDALATALQTLKGEIENVIVKAWMERTGELGTVSGFTAIESEFVASSEGEKNVGDVVMAFAMAFIEGPDDFPAPTLVELEEVAIYPDLVNVFDPAGTYAPIQHPFPAAVEPAPRTSGPDGRVEGGALIETEYAD